MACLTCKKKNLAGRIRAHDDPQGQRLAEERAKFCEKCDYLNDDLTCRAMIAADVIYVPTLIRQKVMHCPFGLW